MKKRELEELKSSSTKSLRDVIEIETSGENPTDRMEIVTEKEFGGFISEADKIASKGSKNYLASNTVSKDQIEEAKRDVTDEIEKAYNIFNRLNDLARENHFVVENEEDNLVLVNERKVYELYEKLKNGLLTPEEFSDLVNYTRIMSHNEYLRNYVDMGRAVTMDKIQKLEKESAKKVLMVFKPVMTKLKEKLGDFDAISLDAFENPEEIAADIDEKTKIEAKEIEDKVTAIFESFFDGNLDEIIDSNYNENDLADLLEETEKLKAKYDKTNISPNDDGLYPIESIQKRDEAWAEYIDSFNKTIKALQISYLKNCYKDSQKYKVQETSSGNMICLKIGDEFLSISKDVDKFADDVAKFYKKVNEYENKLDAEKEEDIKIDPLEPIKDLEIPLPASEKVENNEDDDKSKEEAPKSDPLERIRNIEIPLTPSQKEDESNEEPIEKEIEIPVPASIKESEEKLPETTNDIDIPLPAPVEEQFEENKTEKIEEPVTEPEVIVPVIEEEKPKEEMKKEQEEKHDNPAVTEPVVSVNPGPITSSKAAYIEFMSCFVSKDEATELATDENIDAFETSNLGFNRYISELNTGKIASNATYEDFILNTLERDKGIKYGEPVDLVSKKDDSGLDVIVSDQPESKEPDLSGLDIFADDPLEFADDSGQFTPKTR